MPCIQDPHIWLSYLEGSLPEAQQKALRSQVASCESCQQQVKQFQELEYLIPQLPAYPMPESSEQTEPLFISASPSPPKSEKVIPFSARIGYAVQVAAAVVILGLGYLLGSQRQDTQQQQELLALQADMQEMKELMLLNMLQQQSASKRIKAVNTTRAESGISPKVIQALIQTLKSDDHVNVRLAAVSALDRYQQIPEVRASLLSALHTQKDPVIQIALINLMIEREEKAAIPPIRELIKEDHTLPVVKDHAEKGLLILL